MISRAENINHSILIWARETAGLSVEDAAARLGLTSGAGGTSTDKLEAFERGELKPTRKQLLKIAATYRRPLTAFYRATPPAPGNRGEDFRTLVGAISKREAALLDALIRDIRARQDLVRSILEDDEDVGPLAFVGSLQVIQDVADAAQTIRTALHIDEDHIFNQVLDTAYAADLTDHELCCGQRAHSDLHPDRRLRRYFAGGLTKA